MFFLQQTKITLHNLRANKMRSFLTMLGIIIGIATVVMIVSVGNGAQSLIVNQIKGVGSNLVGILPGASEDEGPPAAALGIVITTLTNEDIQALANKKNVTNALASNAYVRGVTTARWQNRSIDTNFVGTNYSYPEVEDTEVSFGRFYTIDEEKARDRVAVLGDQIFQDLFEGEDPVGQVIKIKKEAFKVIGVMKKRGVSGFQNPDNQIFVPLTTAQQFLLGIKHVSMARVKIDAEENITQATEEIKATLRERHNIKNEQNDDFTVRNTAQAIQVLTKVTNSLKYFLTAISALALVVGGIGIMNIMLITVNERIKEIGLRKAVGATRKNIILQFLFESIIITMIGGVIGIVFGIFISYIISRVVIHLGYDWDFIVTTESVVLAFSVAGLIGLIFGVYPAIKAAKLNPIDALRYE